MNDYDVESDPGDFGSVAAWAAALLLTLPDEERRAWVRRVRRSHPVFYDYLVYELDRVRPDVAKWKKG